MNQLLLPEEIRWDLKPGGVGVVTLARPPVNALTWKLKRALRALVLSVSREASVRSLVFASGLPETFCAGSDLAELAQDHARPGSAIERTRYEYEMWEELSGLPQPSVAAIDGHALGSGLELAIACDFRIAGDSARLGLPEVKIGGAPGVQTLAQLPAIVGLATARRMLLLGDPLTADEAKSAGLVDAVVPAGKALEAAICRAGRLADLPASSVRFLKRSLLASGAPSLRVVRRVELTGVEELFQAPEMREGIAAFLEKRPADFRGAALNRRRTE